MPVISERSQRGGLLFFFISSWFIYSYSEVKASIKTESAVIRFL